MIKAIICDWSGVYFKTGTNEALKKFYKIIRSPKSKIDAVFSFPIYGNKRWLRWLYNKGKITKRDFWKAVSKKLNLDEKLISKLQQIWHSSFKPDKGMVNIISELRKNYKVLVFSGTIKERVEYLNRKYKLPDRFDDFVLSYEVGFNKDELEFYKALLRKLKKVNLKPKECIFIDDHQEFLDKAKKFGIKTILFKNSQKLKSDLKEFSLKI